jgi:kinesin family protein 2/24
VARIRVVVRKRPINKKELARREEDVVWIDEAGTALQVRMLGVDENKKKL